ncbi:MAG: hypothetical protein JJU02_15905 [Cryomorphaceae bacterium]|nr:hypothetical protein [Cryomorphaceae bacterium]
MAEFDLVGKYLIEMQEENKLYLVLLNYLRIHGIKGDEKDFRIALGNGVEVLVSSKAFYNDYESMRNSFYEAKSRIMELDINDYQSDLIVEMEAVIINQARLVDFWSSSFEDFEEAEFFKRYYSR